MIQSSCYARKTRPPRWMSGSPRTIFSCSTQKCLSPPFTSSRVNRWLLTWPYCSCCPINKWHPLTLAPWPAFRLLVITVSTLVLPLGCTWHIANELTSDYTNVYTIIIMMFHYTSWTNKLLCSRLILITAVRCILILARPFFPRILFIKWRYLQ